MQAARCDEVDAILKRCSGIVVTSDTEILDSGVDFFDLAGWIIEEKKVPIHLLDFYEAR